MSDPAAAAGVYAVFSTLGGRGSLKVMNLPALRPVDDGFAAGQSPRRWPLITIGAAGAAPAASAASAYIHALPGRLRVKIAAAKGAPWTACEIERLLTRLQGSRSVTVNPVTGNALVLYDPAAMGSAEILDVLVSSGFLPQHAADPPTNGHLGNGQRRIAGEELRRGMAQLVVTSALELMLRRVMRRLARL